MINRIKQVYRAYTAKLTSCDLALINQILSEQEAKLFFSMAIFDQYHCINVLHTSMELYNTYPNKSSINLTLLKKAALLHDIGRNGTQITIMGKIYPVLLRKFVSTRFILWGHNHLDTKNLFLQSIAKWGNYFYLYNNHPILGKEKILNLAIAYPTQAVFYKELAYIIANHHCPKKISTSLELEILQRADSLN